MSKPPSGSSGVIVEFMSVGRHLRVTAIDEYSGTEAVIIGDPAMSQEFLKKQALKKLHYVMSKKQG